MENVKTEKGRIKRFFRMFFLIFWMTCSILLLIGFVLDFIQIVKMISEFDYGLAAFSFIELIVGGLGFTFAYYELKHG